MSPRTMTEWRCVLRIAAAPVLLGVMAVAAQAQEAIRPPEVTDSAVTRGRHVYLGPANCVACHGESGRGTADGPPLNDRAWLTGSGTYREILEQVLHGTSGLESKTGRPMPVRGWMPTSDEDVEAVAAYVWRLSHQPEARRPRS